MNPTLGLTRIGVALFATSAFGGCATRIDLVGTGRVTLEPTIDQAIRQPPEVYEDKGTLVVTGRLEHEQQRPTGHVDITVIAPDGVTVYDAQVKYRATTQSSPGTAVRRGRFRPTSSRYESSRVYLIRFPGLPPDGSVIKVKHHTAPHPHREPQPEQP